MVIYLITLPFRLIFGGSEETPSSSEPSAYEAVMASPSPSPSPEPEEYEVTQMAMRDNLIHDTVYEYAYQPDGTYDFTEIYSYTVPATDSIPSI